MQPQLGIMKMFIRSLLRGGQMQPQLVHLEEVY